MPRNFVSKLEAVSPLSSDESDFLSSMLSKVQSIPARRDFQYTTDGQPIAFHVLVSGWALRYSIMQDGGRQVSALFVPGDFIEMGITSQNLSDHGVRAITDSSFVPLPVSKLNLLIENPGIALALLRLIVIERKILQRWLASVGRLSATAAIAHLICELHERLRAIGQADHGSFPFPLNQGLIGEAVGITGVHANRVVRYLRARPKIELSDFSSL